MEEKMFEEEFGNLLKCGICNELLDCAAMISSCDHESMYCFSCLEKSLKFKSVCPYCKKYVRKNAEITHCKLIDELVKIYKNETTNSSSNKATTDSKKKISTKTSKTAVSPTNEATDSVEEESFTEDGNIKNVKCPICEALFSEKSINSHLDSCLLTKDKKSSLRQMNRYGKMTSWELKKRLKKRSLSICGLKKDMIQRLIDHECKNVPAESPKISDECTNVLTSEKPRDERLLRPKRTSAAETSLSIESTSGKYTKTGENDVEKDDIDTDEPITGINRQEVMPNPAKRPRKSTDRPDSSETRAPAKNADYYAKMKVKTLQKILRKKKIPSNGKKQALVERILESEQTAPPRINVRAEVHRANSYTDLSTTDEPIFVKTTVNCVIYSPMKHNSKNRPEDLTLKIFGPELFRKKADAAAEYSDINSSGSSVVDETNNKLLNNGASSSVSCSHNSESTNTASSVNTTREPMTRTVSDNKWYLRLKNEVVSDFNRPSKSQRFNITVKPEDISPKSMKTMNNTADEDHDLNEALQTAGIACVSPTVSQQLVLDDDDDDSDDDDDKDCGDYEDNEEPDSDAEPEDMLSNIKENIGCFESENGREEFEPSLLWPTLMRSKSSKQNKTPKKDFLQSVDTNEADLLESPVIPPLCKIPPRTVSRRTRRKLQSD
ncbi:uncharacterized protein LOC141902424 [Tubulanus polymorphus]|uniref:uncharacterized protein LOC141902424 n=1 Tax=Tubulanus polymorphus TaxID=672921 RepID=UPI003DA65AEF